MLHPEIAILDEYRLQHDYSFAKLAEEMEGLGIHISPRTLHYILKGLKPSEPRDRTLYKFKRFLALQNVATVPDPDQESPEPEATPDPVSV